MIEDNAQAMGLEPAQLEQIRRAQKKRESLVEEVSKELRQRVGAGDVIVIANFGGEFVVSDINDDGTDYSPERAKAETLVKLTGYCSELARGANYDVMRRELEKESATNRSPKAS